MPLRHDQLLQALRPLSIAKTCVALLQCSSWTCWSSPLVVRKACWLQWPSLKLYGKPICAYWGRLDVGLVCSVFFIYVLFFTLFALINIMQVVSHSHGHNRSSTRLHHMKKLCSVFFTFCCGFDFANKNVRYLFTLCDCMDCKQFCCTFWLSNIPF